jgi:hypothetical protein
MLAQPLDWHEAFFKEVIREIVQDRSFPVEILAVTTFCNQASGIAAFALVTTAGAFYAYRTLHSLGWYIAFGTTVRGKLVPSRIFGSASA